ncbi:hypothetical protein [Leekyejoonella antrihumi]|uniref:Glycosyltransferase RgtA/B/C/D-like domain-containing protein n=1 Tax=Leekyejoonella antrihumi TaxID=1660198 RepID=A0A563DUV1_9MICO|nr:hypothetical protein [Leekyejoonella antrihumi]TWP33713.1 hypothetical protein FGL98_19935 [Leekyejoonella antrihumi]
MTAHGKPTTPAVDEGAPAETRLRYVAGIGPISALSLSAIIVFLALSTQLGADCEWLVALGRHIVAQRGIPDGVPFAAAPTSGWHNVPVLAELTFAGIAHFGPIGLVVAQLVADGGAMILVGIGARRMGASDRSTALMLILVTLGGLSGLVIARVQLFSLVAFAVMLLLLRSDQARPSRRLWWLVPLVVVWGNLHGAVLVGVVLAVCYLLIWRLRRRPSETVAIGVASVAGICVTPAGLGTVNYYSAVMQNEGAARGLGMWAPPSAHSVLDLLMLAGCALLTYRFVRSGRPLWELVAAAGLIVGTATSARYGIWLLLFVAAPAAVGARRAVEREKQASGGRDTLVKLVSAGVLTILVAGFVLQVRGQTMFFTTEKVSAAVNQVAVGRVVLAPDPLSESLAVAGARVWISDPIDAFSRRDQVMYINFLDGSPAAHRTLDGVGVVVVSDGTEASAVVAGDKRFHLVRSVEQWRIYARD